MAKCITNPSIESFKYLRNLRDLLYGCIFHALNPELEILLCTGERVTLEAVKQYRIQNFSNEIPIFNGAGN